LFQGVKKIKFLEFSDFSSIEIKVRKNFIKKLLKKKI